MRSEGSTASLKGVSFRQRGGNMNPIDYMEKRLKEDERLDGRYDIALSEDHNFLKSIAEAALKGATDG